MKVRVVGQAQAGALLWRRQASMGPLRLTAFVKGRFRLQPGAPMVLEGYAQLRPQDWVAQRPQVDVVLCGSVPLTTELLQASAARLVVERAGERLLNKAIEFGAIPLEKLSRGQVELRELGLGAKSVVPFPVAADGTLEWPAGIDSAQLQCAPTDQRLNGLDGDEWLGLRGLGAGGAMATRLPEVQVAARVFRLDRPTLDVPLRIDAMEVDLDTSTCELSWRGEVELSPADRPELLRLAAGLFSRDETVVLPVLSISPNPIKGLSTIDTDVAKLGLPAMPFVGAHNAARPSPNDSTASDPQQPAYLAQLIETADLEPAVNDSPAPTPGAAQRLDNLERTLDLEPATAHQSEDDSDPFRGTVELDAAVALEMLSASGVPFAGDAPAPEPLGLVPSDALGETGEIDDPAQLERVSRPVLPFEPPEPGAEAIELNDDPNEEGPLRQTYELSGGLQAIFGAEEALPFDKGQGQQDDVDPASADGRLGEVFLTALDALR